MVLEGFKPRRLFCVRKWNLRSRIFSRSRKNCQFYLGTMRDFERILEIPYVQMAMAVIFSTTHGVNSAEAKTYF